MTVCTTDAYLRLHLRIVHDGLEGHTCQLWFQLLTSCRLTILDLAHTGFEVIQRQVADLIFKTAEIHGGIFYFGGWENER